MTLLPWVGACVLIVNGRKCRLLPGAACCAAQTNETNTSDCGVLAMKYKIESSPLWQAKYDVLVCGVFHDEDIALAFRSVDASLQNDKNGFLEKLVNAAKDDGFVGKSGQTMVLPTYGEIAAKRLMLVGLGKE